MAVAMDNAILENILRQVRPLIGQGKVADYIPALATVDGSRLGIAICTVDGQLFQAGDAQERFSIQSISKVLSLVVAMRHYSEEEIWQRVGKDPSGSPFNSLVQLEMEQGIPRNPFINAGALVVCDMLQGRLSAPRQRMLEVVRGLSGVSDISYDTVVARSEFEHSARNAAIAWLMKSFGNFHHDVTTVPHLGIKFTLAPFSILGVAIAIFLGFRNNAGYARYVEARKLWGQLMIASRSLLREVKTTLPDSASVREFARLQIVFAHCLRMTLRKQPQAEVLAHYLKTEDLQRVLASNSPANRILLIMGEWLAVQRRNGQLSDILFISLNDRLNDISAVLAGCERIAYTPIPFAYTLILHRTVYLFCIMLPFALVVDLHYMTPFISVLISYTFISLDCLAEELEDPFGTENNDLPLDAICNAIEIDLLQMNDEAEIPAKILPDRHYQLT